MGVAETMERYGFTKLCNILFVRHLVSKVQQEKSPLFVFSVHPGWVETDIGGDDKGSFIRAFESLVAKTPEDGAISSVYCACDPAVVSAKSKNGGYYEGVDTKGKLKDYAKDSETAKDLWEWTEKIAFGEEGIEVKKETEVKEKQVKSKEKDVKESKLKEVKSNEKETEVKEKEVKSKEVNSNEKEAKKLKEKSLKGNESKEVKSNENKLKETEKGKTS